MGSGFYAIHCNHRGAALLVSRNVKILQQSCTIAVHVEHAASSSAGTAVAAAKPPLGKIQPHSVLFVCNNRNEVVKVSISLPFEEPGVCDLGQVIRMKCSSATLEESLRIP